MTENIVEYAKQITDSDKFLNKFLTQMDDF